MLSNEEKKAIEYLKIEYEKLMKEDNILFPLYKSDAKRLIDIIEKQSKEIEELKEKNKKYKVQLTDKQYRKLVNIKRKLANIIGKQQKEIEELKEDLKKKPMFLIKDIYSPKLKEINLQDVEGLIEQGREEINDKIKAKIEEIEKDKYISNSDFIEFAEYARDYAKKKVQSLLEKE